MVQLLMTVHKMFKNGFFEACKVRLVFDMGRHHIPDHPQLIDHACSFFRSRLHSRCQYSTATPSLYRPTVDRGVDRYIGGHPL